MTQRVMILATDGYEQSELTGPKAKLEKAGIQTTVVSIEPGEIQGWDDDDWGDSVDVDATLDDVNVAEFDALLLPGGQINPDILRTNEKAVGIVREFDRAGKPIAAICHAPWLLIEADIVSGRTVTGWKSIRTDLRNAGANVVDQQVAKDGNLITSRCPDDIPAFSQALIDSMNEMAKEPA